jgi:benzoyl-CoA reductase/2-hydroxyglutaryl-CoA dehydratase subunit BcrC/BadD/HgdB
VKEYQIDGVINFNHLGCRQMGPTFKIYKDVLNELDVPILNIDCDLVDPTITSVDEVRQKMEQFFELLEDR